MTHSHNMIDKVKQTVKRYSMLSEGSAVLTGFSGGADSMALLSLLWRLSKEHSWKVCALHVNHGIRGAEADQDEQVCSRFCQERNIPFYVLHADVPQVSRQTGEGLEECGRRIRYEWFQKMGETLYPDSDWKIATAHTASDSIETVLFHLSRGTSLKGMTGIPPVRDQIIRPLIDCTREETEAYCQDNGLFYVTDRTNFDNCYARNRIRNNILPEFEKVHSEAAASMNRSIQSFRVDEEFLEAETEKVLNLAEQEGTYQAQILCEAPKALAYRALAEIITRYTGEQPKTKHIEKAYSLLHQGGTIQLPTGIYLIVRDGMVYSQSITAKDVEEIPPFALNGADRLSLPYGILHLRVEKNTGALLENKVDYDKITGDFIVRNRRPGDRFRPPKRGVSKTLKSLFEERNIPPERRNSITILEKDGQIAWMEGFGPSEPFMADSKSQNVMSVSVERNDTCGGTKHVQ